MASLQIRKLPVEIYQALKKAAERERRSMSQQAIVELEKALNMPEDRKKRRKEVLKNILENNKDLPKVDSETWIKWIREDRER